MLQKCARHVEAISLSLKERSALGINQQANRACELLIEERALTGEERETIAKTARDDSIKSSVRMLYLRIRTTMSRRFRSYIDSWLMNPA